MTLEGRVALVSGGGRGVGRGIALGLAQDGADIVINYRRDEEAANELVREIEQMGRRAKAYAASVDSWDDDQAMVEAAVKDFGHIDILVNNAGIASRGQSVENTDPAEMERVLRTHAFGSFYLSKLVIPHMRGRERGDIIFISSVATATNGANGAPYNMGKAAIEALSMTLAKEVVGDNIRVNIVAPGLVETEMGKRLVRATQGVEDIATLHESSPFGRVCQPADIANVVRFLVSDLGSYVSGQRIYVDGGAGSSRR